MSNICWKCFGEYDEGKVCPHCGYDNASQEGKYPLALQPGSVLGGRYIVGRVLGQGGFGITYAAQDYDTKQLVAIKEHFPSALVTRVNGVSVSLISESMKEGFIEGKEKFLAEAKTLSQFNGLDNICDIYSYFEENGSAYFAMEYVEGIPLDSYVKKLGRPLDFDEASRLILPIMDALGHVHEKGIIHRDISPDNIMVTADGDVKLIDFGAARYSMGEKSRSLDVILKHGFAPREQYNRHGRQGPFTDVYALGATLYYLLSGKVPQDALDRMESDELAALSSLGIKMPGYAERAVMKALEVSPENRFRSMSDFASHLRKEQPKKKDETLPKESRKKTEEKHPAKAADSGRELPAKKKKPLAVIAAIALALAAAAALVFGFSGGEKWKLDSEGVLYIDITGDMPDYSEEGTPWAAEKSNIKHVVLSEGTSSISAYAFAEYENLETVSIPQGVLRIEDGAFENCRKLESVSLPDGLKSIGKSAFKNCRFLVSINLPDSVSEIGASAFNGCSNLKQVKLPKKLKTVPEQGFAHCVGLTEVVMPEGLESIEKKAFENCGLINRLIIPDSVTSIGQGAFSYCTSVKELSLPDGIEEIPYNMLGGCIGLEKLSLPSSIINIDEKAFTSCKSLDDVEFRGTPEKWSKVKLAENNDELLWAKFNFPGTEQILIPKLTYEHFEKDVYLGGIYHHGYDRLVKPIENCTSITARVQLHQYGGEMVNWQLYVLTSEDKWVSAGGNTLGGMGLMGKEHDLIYTFDEPTDFIGFQFSPSGFIGSISFRVDYVDILCDKQAE